MKINYFRVDHEFLSKLNLLILEKYKDLNLKEEENVSEYQENHEEVSNSALKNSESTKINEKSDTKISSSSLFCFRLFSATKRFNI